MKHLYNLMEPNGTPIDPCGTMLDRGGIPMELLGPLWDLMEPHRKKNMYEPNGSFQKPI